MKTFVIGDIHGAHKALIQCLERSKFDRQNDHLIVLGDVCDGFPEVNLCIDELLKVKHCDYVIGNHDLWTLSWALDRKKDEEWLAQGGQATVQSYNDDWMPQSHVKFLKKAHGFFEVDEKVFVHGGFDPIVPLEDQGKSKFAWDRELITAARRKSLEDKKYKFSVYEEIFLGHTPTTNFGSELPLQMCNIWAMDTGAGWGGALTIMDIDTKKYWQSDKTSMLYEGIPTRS